jgi:protein phosphatase
MVKDDQSTFISHRYLWAVGLENSPPGSLLGDRYRVIESQIISDTQIFKFPEIPEEVSPYVSAYLKLAKLPLHIPRPYGFLKTGDPELDLLLLDRAPISLEGKLYPNLKDTWAEVEPMRQLSLMGQVLQLWQPLSEVGMTSTLLEPEKLRVNGAWIRVLELLVDEEEVKLADLGNLWIDWLESARPEVSDALADFCFGLSRGEFDLAGAIAVIDKLRSQLAPSQLSNFHIRIASGTDKGPRRDHNEDNCYPTPEAQKRLQQSKILCDRLAIICDGLGGHEGGEIASSMAIKTIETELEIVLTELDNDSAPFSPTQFMHRLDQVTRKANDQIVALNDQHQKQAQQRMGTTLVMAVIPHPHEVYIVNVGDSRLYWLQHQSCDQVTVDDDVSTRDVILGFSFYAHAAQRIDGGSLIQALGTRSSELLYPRIQRLPIDGNCLFLLCSDGLSDYDRVEEILDIHIRPILSNDTSLHKSVEKLIDQGNQRNGHDNVTVALMRCKLLAEGETDDMGDTDDTLPTETTKFQAFFGEDVPLISEDTSSEVTEDLTPASRFNLSVLIMGIVIVILGVMAILHYTPIKTWIYPSQDVQNNQRQN